MASFLTMIAPRASFSWPVISWRLEHPAGSTGSRLGSGCVILGSRKGRSISGCRAIWLPHHDSFAAFLSTNLEKGLAEAWQWFGSEYSTSHLIKRLIKTHQKLEDAFGFYYSFEIGSVIRALPFMRFKEVQLLPIPRQGGEKGGDCVFSLP